MSQGYDIVRTYTAGAAIAAKRIVKFSADYTVIQGAAANDALIGVADLAAVATGDRVDVSREGLVDVEYGGTVARGDLLTSDATGRAVTAAPAAGVNNRIVGIAEVSGVVGDIGSVLLSVGSTQG